MIALGPIGAAVDKEEVKIAARRQTAWVLGVALAARLCVVGFVLTRMPRGWLWTRGTEMGFLATSLVRGRGLSDPYGVPTGPSAAVGPGYPLLLAAVFRVFGVESVAAELAVLLAQTGMSLLILWLMQRLAGRLGASDGGVKVAIFWSVSLATVWMPAILWDTSLSALFLLAGVACAIDLERAPSRAWLGYGVGCGLAGLLNPSLLPSLGALGMLAAWRGERWRAAVFACLLFTAVYGAWPIRNARVFHAVILTRSVAGYNLWVGNRAGADGYLDESLFPTANAAQLAAYRAEGEVGYDAEKMRLARAAIARDPAGFLRLTALRAWRFWSGTGTRGGSLFLPLHGGVTMLLGVCGFWRLWQRSKRDALYFAVVVAIFPLPYLVTHAEFRYRLVVDPVLCVLGAVWLHGGEEEEQTREQHGDGIDEFGAARLRGGGGWGGHDVAPKGVVKARIPRCSSDVSHDAVTT